MTTEFAHSNLWQKITSLAKKAKRRYAAVAYLGAGAFELLPLGSGDLLVVDLSLSAVRSGQTNPYEVEKYIRNGVEVHSRPNLHAKVFVLDTKAVVGSANVSHNSQNILIETAIITNDKEIIRAARGFVFSLRGEYVTPAYLKTCKREYQPHWSSKKANDDQESPLWVHRIHPLMRDDKKRERAKRVGLLAANKRLQSKRRYDSEWVTYPTSNQFVQQAKINDLYIQVWREDNGPLLVYPPARIINLKPYVNERASHQTLVFLEFPTHPKCLEWHEFKRDLKRLGITGVGENLLRKIKDPEVKRSVLGLWQTIHDE